MSDDPDRIPVGVLLKYGTHKPHETCRAPYNHDWVEEESATRPEGGGFYLAMRCTKCNTTFKQIVNYDGSLYSGRQYHYEKDYVNPDKWSRSEWRLSYLLKLNGKARARR